MDPLSDVLSLLTPRSYMFRGLDIGGQWSIRFPPNDGIRCYAVLSGECWLSVDGVPDAVQLMTGDCVLLTNAQPFRLASSPTITPVDWIALFSAAPEGGVVTINGGGGLIGVGGYVNFAGKQARVLLERLPAVVHLRKESDRAALRWSMEMMMQELREPQPGGSLVAAHLVHLMLILALRLHIAQGARTGSGWLSALADKPIAAAMNAMHSDPAHCWTLQALADLASMSRSTFALKFKRIVGEPPMAYLIRWRMMLAADKLANSGDSISEIAYSLGYESDSAFSVAFRRVMGRSPRRYAQGRGPEAKFDTGALSLDFRAAIAQAPPAASSSR